MLSSRRARCRRICVNSHRHGGNYWLLVTLRRYESLARLNANFLTAKNKSRIFYSHFRFDVTDFYPFSPAVISFCRRFNANTRFSIKANVSNEEKINLQKQEIHFFDAHFPLFPFFFFPFLFWQMTFSIFRNEEFRSTNERMLELK